MAGISDIIAYGFGSWGSVNKVPTLGFSSAAVAVGVGLEGIEFAATGGPLHYVAPWTPLEYAAVVNRLHFTGEEGDT